MAPANCKVVLPKAPRRPVTLNGGKKMNAWCDLYKKTKDIDKKAPYTNYDQSTLQDSADRIAKLILLEAALLENNTQRVFVAGLSQGCHAALATLLKFNGG